MAWVVVREVSKIISHFYLKNFQHSLQLILGLGLEKKMDLVEDLQWFFLVVLLPVLILPEELILCCTMRTCD